MLGVQRIKACIVPFGIEPHRVKAFIGAKDRDENNPIFTFLFKYKWDREGRGSVVGNHKVKAPKL